MFSSKYFSQLYRQDPNYFNHIEGLRAIAAFWMILYHIAVFAPIFVPSSELGKLFEHPFFKIALSTTVSLDIFFVISGLVIGYALIKELKDTGSVNVYRFLLRRCARVYPLYLLVILFCDLMSGSTFHNAWANVLQLNNLIPVEYQHVPWAWSLAIDFQFYVIFSLILWLISKNLLGKSSCFTLALLVFLMPIVSTALVMKSHHLHTLSLNMYNLRTPESWEYFNIGFSQLYVRSGPFLYGVLSAYVLVHHKNRLRQILQNIDKGIINLIAIALLFMMCFILVNDPIWFLNRSEATWQTSIHWSLLTSRNIFSLLLCAMLLLAEFPRGIVMKLFLKMLSSAILRPFGQLTFTTYMVHPIIITIGYTIFIALHKTISPVEYWKFGLWLVLIVYLISVPLYLYIEQPPMDYLKHRLQRQRRQNEQLAV